MEVMAEAARKHPNGRYTDEFKAVVVAWVGEGGRTLQGGSEHWNVPRKSVRGWCRAAGVSPRPVQEKAAARPSRAREDADKRRHRAPIADLGEAERARTVTTATNITATLELGSAMLLEHVRSLRDGGEPLELDVKICAALLNLSKTASNLIDTHPGLLRVAGVKEARDSGERDLSRVAAALGLGKKSQQGDA